MKIQNTFRRGFTLIELMIVIVILGILMGTILPRLTGAQARARDTARKADLTNISQALELYYNDKGSYPVLTSGNCLDPSLTTDATVTDLGSYMKGGKVPAAVSKKQVTLGCTGSYYYSPITSGGIASASYVLATDMETWQMANYMATGNPPTSTTFTSASKAEDISKLIGSVIKEGDNTQQTIYVVMP